MYEFYLGGILYPVPPPKLDLAIRGINKTITLIHEGEVNQIKPAGLTELSFELRLPAFEGDPYANYANKKFLPIEYYLGHLEMLKIQMEPFQFKIIRKMPEQEKKEKEEKIDLLENIRVDSILVTLEEYDITEDSEEGFDVLVAITLKQYREYGVKILEIVDKKEEEDIVDPSVPKNSNKKATKKKKTENRMTNAKIKELRGRYKAAPTTYTVKKGDSLWKIAKKELNNEKKYKEIYDLNKNLIESDAKKHGKKSSLKGHFIYPGLVLKLP